ncbi:hypothetical protein DCS_05901 [Drechmeria coniospora]|uniref:Enterotoxin n=1 Tax=Drechmeria coniospora TaxID=98403 RepID=A0A151GA38_DRECN|nr:hypothetical protein DCS_05901 [Drechmeria coniospora]KYK53952.1 hypothetical protein DCS_05901 [Drechmeria coniospora]
MILTPSIGFACWAALLWFFLPNLSSARRSRDTLAAGWITNVRRTLITRDEPPINLVFRGDMRPFYHVKPEGGFFPQDPIYPTSNKPFRIALHMRNKKLQKTAFVSTSHNPDTAIAYARGIDESSGFLYLIHPTPNIIDSTTSKIGDLIYNEECLALGGISWSQVVGWVGYDEYKAWQNLRSPDLEGLSFSGKSQLTPALREQFMKEMPRMTKNPDYLGDLYATSELSSLTETVDFENRKQAELFMQKVGSGKDVGWKGKFPLPNDVRNNRLLAKLRKMPELLQNGDSNNGAPGRKRPNIDREPQSSDSRILEDSLGTFNPCSLGSRKRSGECQPKDKLVEPEEPVSPSTRRVNVPEEIPKTPVEMLVPKLVKGLSWLQVARILTNIVDSATNRIQAAPLDDSHETLSSELKKAGMVLSGILNDTVPGLVEVEDHTAELSRKLASIQNSDSALDKARSVLTAILEYDAQLELTIFENYIPGVPELIKNYQKEYAEYKKFKGEENPFAKGKRIAEYITNGAFDTLNDVIRDWVPGYQEAEDSITIEAEKIHRKIEDKSESFWDIVQAEIAAPAKVVTDALHLVLQNYIPGEKQVEGLIFSNGQDDKTLQPSEKLSPEMASSSTSSPLPKHIREQ